MWGQAVKRGDKRHRVARARLEVQQVMNGERGCGFLFPLLIAVEKKYLKNGLPARQILREFPWLQRLC